MKQPYYAVIFSSQQSEHTQGYEEVAQRMVALASSQPGFLGIESVRDPSGKGITVSYWESLESIASWKENAEHRIAQERGRSQWYSTFQVRICLVEREYGF